MKTQLEIDRIKTELDNELNPQAIAKGQIDILVKYTILQFAESIGALKLYGASDEFIESIMNEALHGAAIGKTVRMNLG